MTRVVVVGGSAGSLEALFAVAAGLRPDFAAPMVIVVHVGAYRSRLPELLRTRGRLDATHARDGEPLRSGHLHVAPPDRHLCIDGDVLRLNRSAKEHHTRPAIDPLFRSAALSHGPGAIGVVLSGHLDDGTAGLQAIVACGGAAVVQDPREAAEPSMPRSALRHVGGAQRAGLARLPELLSALAGAPTGTAQVPSPALRLEHVSWIGRPMMGDALDAVGDRTSLTCPDCHGSLWELRDTAPIRYRCHTGHAFTMRTLQNAQSLATEEALWSAIRALGEKRMLLERMARAARAEGEAAHAGTLELDANRFAEQAQRLCELAATAPERDPADASEDDASLASPDRPAGQPVPNGA